MSAKDDERLRRESGLKLANFRNKLALATGKQKITQEEFGKIAGEYSGRAISSYETGRVEIPGLFLYRMWKAGYPVDRIFSETEVVVPGGDEMKDDNRSKLSLTDASVIDTSPPLREPPHWEYIEKLREGIADDAARKNFDQGVLNAAEKFFEKMGGILREFDDARDVGRIRKATPGHSKKVLSKKHRRR